MENEKERTLTVDTSMIEVVVCSDFSEFKKTWKDSEMADWSNSENISIPS